MKYVLILITSYGDGWSEGSMIRIKKGNTLYVESRMDVGFETLLQWERDLFEVTTVAPTTQPPTTQPPTTQPPTTVAPTTQTPTTQPPLNYVQIAPPTVRSLDSGFVVVTFTAEDTDALYYLHLKCDESIEWYNNENTVVYSSVPEGNCTLIGNSTYFNNKEITINIIIEGVIEYSPVFSSTMSIYSFVVSKQNYTPSCSGGLALLSVQYTYFSPNTSNYHAMSLYYLHKELIIEIYSMNRHFKIDYCLPNDFFRMVVMEWTYEVIIFENNVFKAYSIVDDGIIFEVTTASISQGDPSIVSVWSNPDCFTIPLNVTVFIVKYSCNIPRIDSLDLQGVSQYLSSGILFFTQ